ncbi:hypothetical protein ACP70R_040844 [Stipagrostis hirtigluma subsp. patula]
MAASACQSFREEGEQQEQHLALRHGDCVLPLHRGTAPWQASPAPPPAAPERSSSSSGMSATEARAIHCEAERRRRERINAHLAALRKMVPDPKQMDKATLLARVVTQLKDLKRRASETTQPTPIPAEANGITVHCSTITAAIAGERTVYITASFSCDDRPGLLADLAGACRGLRLRALRADMASLGGRTQCNLLLCREGGSVSRDGMKGLEEAVRQAMANVAFPEMVYGGGISRSKRQRVLESCYVLG